MGVMDLRRNIQLNEPHIATVTGNPVSVKTDVKGFLGECKASFTPIQPGTGDPSPSNVRPITGWTGVTAYRMGKNLLNPIWWNDVSSNISWVNYTDGTTQHQSNAYKASDYVNVVGNAEYTLHVGMNAQASGGMAFYDASKQYISGIQMKSATKTDYTFTTPANAVYMRFSCLNTIVPFEEVMLVFGSTAPSTYEAYSGNSYPVTFPAMGKNLFDQSALMSGTLSGNGQYSTNLSRTVTDFITLEAGTYTISRATVAENDYWKAYSYTMENVMIKQLFNYGSGSITRTFTLDERSKVRIALDYIPPANNNIQLELGSTVTAFEPYTNTVYGGSLDVVTGKLTVEWVLRDMSEMAITAPSSESAPWDHIFTIRPVWVTGVGYEKAPGETNIVCEVAKLRGSGSYANYTIGGTSNSAAMYFYDNTIDPTTDAFMQKYTGYKITYELLPSLYQTFQLTPQQIKSLVGDNTMWSDANGNLEIKLWKH